MRPQRAIVRCSQIQTQNHRSPSRSRLPRDQTRGIVGAGDIAIRGRVQRESPPPSRVCRIHFRLAGQESLPREGTRRVSTSHGSSLSLFHDDRRQRRCDSITRRPLLHRAPPADVCAAECHNASNSLVSHSGQVLESYRRGDIGVFSEICESARNSSDAPETLNPSKNRVLKRPVFYSTRKLSEF